MKPKDAVKTEDVRIKLRRDAKREADRLAAEYERATESERDAMVDELFARIVE